jgi:hypothetical protein
MGRDELDDMTPEEIRDWAEQQRERSRAAYAGQPVPEISRVKRDDYPHWKVVAYMFHTRAGDRVLVARGDDAEVEGVLGGVRAGRGQDELMVDLGGETWACTRSDGKDWSPDRRGRTRVETLKVSVLARRADGAGRVEKWTLQTNMEGQP